MCGIAGILHFDRRPVESDVLSRMSALMQERGPDDEGFYIGDGIGLAHRRLSIIDLSVDAKCPMANEDGSVQIVYNGEIYNYKELRKELLDRGHFFRTHSDTEVIVHGYEEWGKDVTNRIEGMFAFAIWDVSERILFLARDRFGEKPLYYLHSDTSFVFASTLPAIACSDFHSLSLDPVSMITYLTQSYISGPATAWKEIRQLKPAYQMLVHQKGTVYQSKYWEFSQGQPQPIGIKDAGINILEKLENSIKRRLVADVPVGGFLSGGVDSSLAMALAAKYMGGIKTFAYR